MIYRQGDVLLKSVGRIPRAAKPVKARDGRFILAHGEVTNHAHTIAEVDGSLFIDENRLYLRTEAGCELLHQEHGPISIPAGSFEVIRQREYSPEAIRNVAD